MSVNVCACVCARTCACACVRACANVWGESKISLCSVASHPPRMQYANQASANRKVLLSHLKCKSMCRSDLGENTRRLSLSFAWKVGSLFQPSLNNLCKVDRKQPFNSLLLWPHQPLGNAGASALEPCGIFIIQSVSRWVWLHRADKMSPLWLNLPLWCQYTQLIEFISPE